MDTKLEYMNMYMNMDTKLEYMNMKTEVLSLEPLKLVSKTNTIL